MAKSWAKFKKAFFINFASIFIYILIRLIFLTCKKNYSQTTLSSEPCVALFWHSRLAMMCFVYKHWWQKNRKVKVIISDHKDGEIITRVMKFFSIDAIRGSSSKGGAKALIEALREIRNNVDIIITPDGPRGPRHSVADGAVIIAQKQNVKIRILNYEASKFWQFKSWDKMILPKPFSTINFSLSNPIDISNLSLQEAKDRLQNALWLASEKDGGASVAENKREFISNLKIKN